MQNDFQPSTPTETRNTDDTYEVKVITEETVLSSQTLHVRARTPEEAESTVECGSETWRNGEDSADIKIVAPEQVVDAELVSIRCTVRGPLNLQKAAPLDGRKVRAVIPDAAGARLLRLNKSLKHGLEMRPNGLWITVAGRSIHLAVPTALQERVHASLAGSGERPAAVAKKLSSYGLSEWERRFSNAFPDDEPDADRLTKPTDHSWPVI